MECMESKTGPEMWTLGVTGKASNKLKVGFTPEWKHLKNAPIYKGKYDALLKFLGTEPEPTAEPTQEAVVEGECEEVLMNLYNKVKKIVVTRDISKALSSRSHVVYAEVSKEADVQEFFPSKMCDMLQQVNTFIILVGQCAQSAAEHIENEIGKEFDMSVQAIDLFTTEDDMIVGLARHNSEKSTKVPVYLMAKGLFPTVHPYMTIHVPWRPSILKYFLEIGHDSIPLSGKDARKFLLLTANNTNRTAQTWYNLVSMYTVVLADYHVKVFCPYDDINMPFKTLERNLKERTTKFSADTSLLSKDEVQLWWTGRTVTQQALLALDSVLMRETKQRMRDEERAKKELEREQERERRREEKEQQRKMKKEKVMKKSEEVEELIAQGPIVPGTTTSEDEDEEMEGEEEQEGEEEVQSSETEGEPADPSPQKPSPRMEKPKTKSTRRQTTLTQIQGGVTHEPV